MTRAEMCRHARRGLWFPLALLLAPLPALAQFGALDKVKQRIDQAQKITDINMSDQEERQLGDQVSARLCDRFGVYQDVSVTKYVSLVGTVLAQASSRPGLEWQFVILHTDGVNAYATPGGFVHITRGALGLIRNEAELAGVLGHEITHVTAKHTLRAIQKSKAVQYASEKAGSGHGLTSAVIAQLAQKTYDVVLDGAFSRDDELESDRVGIELANKVGYAPGALADVLRRIADRNKGREEPNGLFASHPRIRERIERIDDVINAKRLSGTATVDARYRQNISFEAKPIASIASVEEDSKGLAGAGATKPEETKEASKRKGFGLSSLKLSTGAQGQNSQQVASAGARGGVPDRDAPGGSKRTKVNVRVTVSDVADFKRGIV